MSTATTTEPTTGQTGSRRTTTSPTNSPTSQLERSAANRLRATMAAVRLAFTWAGAGAVQKLDGGVGGQSRSGYGGPVA